MNSTVPLFILQTITSSLYKILGQGSEKGDIKTHAHCLDTHWRLERAERPDELRLDLAVSLIEDVFQIEERQLFAKGISQPTHLQ